MEKKTKVISFSENPSIFEWIARYSDMEEAIITLEVIRNYNGIMCRNYEDESADIQKWIDHLEIEKSTHALLLNS